MEGFRTWNAELYGDMTYICHVRVEKMLGWIWAMESGSWTKFGGEICAMESIALSIKFDLSLFWHAIQYFWWGNGKMGPKKILILVPSLLWNFTHLQYFNHQFFFFYFYLIVGERAFEPCMSHLKNIKRC